jgi:hypothetical protein
MISFDQFKYQKKSFNEIKQPIEKTIEKPIEKSIEDYSRHVPTSPIQVAIPIVDCITIEKKIENISYIYLIREREHYLNNEPIYKFGRCTQLPDHKINRLYHYKKGSEIVMVLQCNDVIHTENKIRVMFKQHFIQHIDGHEHYYGDVKIMKKIIWNIVNT